MKNHKMFHILLTIQIILINLLKEINSAQCVLGDDCRDCRNINPSCSNCNVNTGTCNTCLPGYLSKLSEGTDTTSNPITLSNCVDKEEYPTDEMIDYQKVVTDSSTSMNNLIPFYFDTGPCKIWDRTQGCLSCWADSFFILAGTSNIDQKICPSTAPASTTITTLGPTQNNYKCNFCPFNCVFCNTDLQCSLNEYLNYSSTTRILNSILFYYSNNYPTLLDGKSTEDYLALYNTFTPSAVRPKVNIIDLGAAVKDYTKVSECHNPQTMSTTTSSYSWTFDATKRCYTSSVNTSTQYTTTCSNPIGSCLVNSGSACTKCFPYFYINSSNTCTSCTTSTAFSCNNSGVTTMCQNTYILDTSKATCALISSLTENFLSINCINASYSSADIRTTVKCIKCYDRTLTLNKLFADGRDCVQTCYTPGTFPSKDTGQCMSCPSNCMSCASSDAYTCYSCAWNYSWSAATSAEKTTFSSLNYFNQFLSNYIGRCTLKTNSNGVKLYNIFVGVKRVINNAVSENEKTFNGDGSYNDPYEDLVHIFTEIFNDKFTSPEGTVYLNIYLFNQNHYILNKRYFITTNNSNVAYLTQRKLYINISPFYCGILDDPNGFCVPRGNKITIYNKAEVSGIFKIFSGLNFVDIIFDNIDFYINYPQRLIRQTFCSVDSNGNMLSNNYNCMDNNSNHFRGNYYVEPANYIFEFFKGEFQYTMSIIQVLKIKNCEFRNFFNHGYYSLIKMKSPAFRIDIDSCKFYNFKSYMAIVKNYRTYVKVVNLGGSQTQKSLAYRKDNYDFFMHNSNLNCDYVSNNQLLISCKQISIKNSEFYNFEGLTMKEIGDFGFSRGLIVDLYNFMGDVFIENNKIYNNNAIFGDNYSTLFKSPLLQGSGYSSLVLLNFRYVKRAIIIKNLFQDNVVSNGVILIERDEIPPDIVSSNNDNPNLSFSGNNGLYTRYSLFFLIKENRFLRNFGLAGSAGINIYNVNPFYGGGTIMDNNTFINNIAYSKSDPCGTSILVSAYMANTLKTTSITSTSSILVTFSFINPQNNIGNIADLGKIPTNFALTSYTTLYEASTFRYNEQTFTNNIFMYNYSGQKCSNFLNMVSLPSTPMNSYANSGASNVIFSNNIFSNNGNLFSEIVNTINQKFSTYYNKLVNDLSQAFSYSSINFMSFQDAVKFIVNFKPNLDLEMYDAFLVYSSTATFINQRTTTFMNNTFDQNWSFNYESTEDTAIRSHSLSLIYSSSTSVTNYIISIVNCTFSNHVGFFNYDTIKYWGKSSTFLNFANYYGIALGSIINFASGLSASTLELRNINIFNNLVNSNNKQFFLYEPIKELWPTLTSLYYKHYFKSVTFTNNNAFQRANFQATSIPFNKLYGYVEVDQLNLSSTFISYINETYSNSTITDFSYINYITFDKLYPHSIYYTSPLFLFDIYFTDLSNLLLMSNTFVYNNTLENGLFIITSLMDSFTRSNYCTVNNITIIENILGTLMTNNIENFYGNFNMTNFTILGNLFIENSILKLSAIASTIYFTNFTSETNIVTMRDKTVPVGSNLDSLSLVLNDENKGYFTYMYIRSVQFYHGNITNANLIYNSLQIVPFFYNNLLTMNQQFHVISISPITIFQINFALFSGFNISNLYSVINLSQTNGILNFVNFKNITGNYIINVKSQTTLAMYYVNFVDIKISQKAIIYNTQGSNLKISNATFINNIISGEQAACVVTQESQYNIDSTSFINNTALDTSSIFYVINSNYNLSSAVLNWCYFIENLSFYQNIISISNSIVLITNTTLDSNFAYSYTNNLLIISSTVSISKTKFLVSNYGRIKDLTNLYNKYNPSALTDESTIYQNIYGHFLHINFNSNVTLDNCEFTGGLAYYGGVLFMMYSNLTITNSKFYKNNSTFATLELKDISSLNIYDSLFTENYSENSVSGLIVGNTINNNINISNSVFFNSYSPYVIYLENTIYSFLNNLTIYNDFVRWRDSQAIVAIDTNLVLNNSRIFNFNSMSKSGCAANFLSKKTGISLIMSNNLIKNNFCQKGGGVFVQNIQQVSIENNTFVNNTAISNGGALYLYCYFSFKCKSSFNGINDFFYNLAFIGGAIYWEEIEPFDSKNNQILNSPNLNFSILMPNRAIFYGSKVASFASQLLFVDLKTVKFIKVRYRVNYTISNIGKGSIQVKKQNNTESFITYDSILFQATIFNDLIIQNNTLKSIKLKSGEENYINAIYIVAVDHYNQLVGIGNSTKVSLTPLNSLLISSNYTFNSTEFFNIYDYFKTNTPATFNTDTLRTIIPSSDLNKRKFYNNSILDVTLIKYDINYEVLRVVNLTNIQLFAVPNSSFTMLIETDIIKYEYLINSINLIKKSYTVFSLLDKSFDYSGIKISNQTDDISIYNSLYSMYNYFILYENQILINMTNCDVGEEIKENFNCEKCGVSTFSFNVPTIGSRCLSCPPNINCTGGNVVYPVKGYYRTKANSTNVYRCLFEDACLNNVSINNCAPSYTGPLCSNCAKGYKRSGNFSCSECPSNTLNIIFIILACIVMCVFVYFTLSVNLEKTSSNEPSMQIFIRILLNHFQIISIIALFPLPMPEFIITVYSFIKSVSSFSDNVISFDCLLKDTSLTNDESSSTFFIMSIFYCVLPFLIIILSYLFWKIYLKCKKNMDEFDNKFKITVFFLIYLLHPTLFKQYLIVFKCTSIDNRSLLNEDMRIECWKSDKITDHLYLSLFLVLPSMIFWGLLFPLLLLYQLYKNRDDIVNSQNNMIPSSVSSYAFLYNGYKPKFYYWEFIIIYRKILVLFIFVFLSFLNISLQCILTVLFLTLAIIINELNAPYVDRTMNNLEKSSLLVASFSLYTGVIILHFDQSNKIAVYTLIKYLIVGVIAFLNIYFFMMWLRGVIVFMVQNIDFKNKIFFICCLCKNEAKLEKMKYKHLINKKFDKIEKAFNDFLKDLHKGYDKLFEKMKGNLSDAYYMNTLNKINFSKDAHQFLESEYKDIIHHHKVRIFNVMVELEEHDKPKRRDGDLNLKKDDLEKSEQHEKWVNFLQNFAKEVEENNKLSQEPDEKSIDPDRNESDVSIGSKEEQDLSFNRKVSIVSSPNKSPSIKKNQRSSFLDDFYEIPNEKNNMIPQNRQSIEMEEIKMNNLSNNDNGNNVDNNLEKKTK